MKDHEIILKMIEEVSPNNTVKLDEIDARVWCYLSNFPYKNVFEFTSGNKSFVAKDENGEMIVHSMENYTRSRDALKAIRPEGWATDITAYSTGIDAFCEMHKTVDGDSIHTVSSVYRPTEELAELHAIIQAIAYEQGE